MLLTDLQFRSVVCRSRGGGDIWGGDIWGVSGKTTFGATTFGATTFEAATFGANEFDGEWWMSDFIYLFIVRPRAQKSRGKT